MWREAPEIQSTLARPEIRSVRVPAHKKSRVRGDARFQAHRMRCETPASPASGEWRCRRFCGFDFRLSKPLLKISKDALCPRFFLLPPVGA
jgi:hypothetical protein